MNTPTSSGLDSRSEETNQTVALEKRPKGFRGFYASPYTQVVMLGLVCFMGPGLYNALNGLGGGGQVDSQTAANANVALYSTLAVTAFFAGTINNKLGSRLTLFLGVLGYSLYIGSFLATNLRPNLGPFMVAAGAVLGLSAGLLWDAQGSLMLSYPTEANKGLFIGIFWMIFNLGGVVGASVALGQNFNSQSNGVGNATYIAFLALTLVGAVLPLCMADPNRMYRTDGTRVSSSRRSTWTEELLGLWHALTKDPLIVLLFPLFLVSNWSYTWEFNDYNFALFNIRTRALNNFCYWSSEIVGALLIGLILDSPRLTRRTRAFIGWSILFCAVFGLGGWAFHYQTGYTRESTTSEPFASNKIDFNDTGYVAYAWLFIFLGMLDAMLQTSVYWFMGAMSNDPAKLAHFTGFYKSVQSAGAAGVWRADAVKLPFMNIFASTWALLAGGLVFAAPMLYLRIKNHTDVEEGPVPNVAGAVSEQATVEKSAV